MSYKLVDEYLNYLLNNKNRSINTFNAYRRDLEEFHIYLKEQRYPNTEFAEEFYSHIKLADVNSFVSYLKQDKTINGKEKKGNSPSSINRKGICVKEFFKFLRKNGYVDKSIAEDLELPKIGKRIHETLTIDEVNKLISIADDKGNRYRVRDVCMLIFFLSMGFRVSELCNLKLENIKTDEIIIKGAKGNKERKAFLYEAAIKALENYLEYRKERGLENTEYLFVSRSGKKLEDVGINKIIKKYAKEAGIDKDITAHSLRHSFATLAYNEGNLDIVQLQALLGHENISTTKIYTKINESKLRESANKNPLAHIKINETD